MKYKYRALGKPKQVQHLATAGRTLCQAEKSWGEKTTAMGFIVSHRAHPTRRICKLCEDLAYREPELATLMGERMG